MYYINCFFVWTICFSSQFISVSFSSTGQNKINSPSFNYSGSGKAYIMLIRHFISRRQKAILTSTDVMFTLKSFWFSFTSEKFWIYSVTSTFHESDWVFGRTDNITWFSLKTLTWVLKLRIHLSITTLQISITLFKSIVTYLDDFT